MLRPLNKREKTMLGGLSVIVVAAFLYWVVYRLQWQDYQALKLQVTGKTPLVTQMQECAKKINEMTVDSRRVAEDAKRFNNITPGDEGTVLLYLTNLAKQRGIKVNHYKPIPESQEVLPCQTVEVKVTGSYAAITELLRVLDSPPCITKINLTSLEPVVLSANASSFQGNVLNGLVQASFKLKMYNLPMGLKSPPGVAAKVYKPPVLQKIPVVATKVYQPTMPIKPTQSIKQ